MTIDSLDLPGRAIRLVLSSMGESIRQRTKRALFVFSVMAAIDRTHGLDKKTIIDVNKQLKIAHCDRLCTDAAFSRDIIWGKAAHRGDVVNDFDALTTSTSALERSMIAKYYLKNCPDWLRYGDQNGSEMRRDIQRLFNAIVVRDTA